MRSTGPVDQDVTMPRIWGDRPVMTIGAIDESIHACRHTLTGHRDCPLHMDAGPTLYILFLAYAYCLRP